ncbi:papain-like cysteine protease family protein [Lapillicoccus sp.]|uniref:papain-like cysteine protease family protein n=1 Tax=Lapillicoccus sp. TaxID=1909287 RepID=UPI00326706F3
MSVTQGLIEYDGRLYAAWKGETGDDRIFTSSYDGHSWTEQTVVGGNTSAGPSLGKLGSSMYLAWKGEHSDQRVFSLRVDGSQWQAQQQVPGIGSSTGPAIYDFGGRLYAAWKGVDEDQAIWYSSTADGVTWSGQRTIPGVASSIGPSLCNWQGRLWAAWKGMSNDQALYYASFDGNAWSPQQVLPGVASSVGPSIAAYQEKVYAIWKGVIGDENLYYSYFDGVRWAPQQVVPGVASSVGAALNGYGDSLFAVWKGAGTDQGLYFSSFDGTSWAAQQRVPGNSGPDAPVNIGMQLQYQETSEWCWLAVATSVAHFYNSSSPAEQYDLMTTIGRNINQWVGVSCAPTAPMLAAHPGLANALADPYGTDAENCLERVGIPQVCIKSGGVGDALNVYGNNAGWQGNVSFAQVAAEVHAGRPVCVDITWKNGLGSHVVAIAGALNDQILVLDPANGESVIAFEDFPDQYAAGATLDGFTFTKAR